MLRRSIQGAYAKRRASRIRRRAATPDDAAATCSLICQRNVSARSVIPNEPRRHLTHVMVSDQEPHMRRSIRRRDACEGYGGRTHRHVTRCWKSVLYVVSAMKRRHGSASHCHARLRHDNDNISWGLAFTARQWREFTRIGMLAAAAGRT